MKNNPVFETRLFIKKKKKRKLTYSNSKRNLRKRKFFLPQSIKKQKQKQRSFRQISNSGTGRQKQPSGSAK